MQNIITKLIGLLCLLIATHVVAQNNTNNCYQDLLQRGDQARKNQQYRTAIQKYTAARECDGANGEVLSKRILQVFDDIEKLKQQAEANEKTAEAAQKAAKKAEIEKINALQKKVKSDSISIILNAKNKILQVANDSVALLIEKAKQKISQQVEKQKRTTQLANNLLQAQIIAEDDPTLAYNILSQTIEEDSLNDAQNKNVKKIAQSAIMCNPNNMFAQKMYGQHYGVVAAFFSPDDSLLVSFANSEAKVWTNNSCINTILLPPNLRITNNIAISFSPNKKDALLLHENRIWLLHLTAQKGVVEALDIDGNGEISSISYCNNEEFLFAKINNSEGTLFSYHIPSKKIKELTKKANFVTQNGRYSIGYTNKNGKSILHKYSINTQKSEHQEAVFSIEDIMLSDDGETVLFKKEAKNYYVYSWGEKKMLQQLYNSNENKIYASQFKDNRLLFWANNGYFYKIIKNANPTDMVVYISPNLKTAFAAKHNSNEFVASNKLGVIYGYEYKPINFTISDTVQYYNYFISDTVFFRYDFNKDTLSFYLKNTEKELYRFNKGNVRLPKFKHYKDNWLLGLYHQNGYTLILGSINKKNTLEIYTTPNTQEILNDFSFSTTGDTIVYITNDKVWHYDIKTQKTTYKKHDLSNVFSILVLNNQMLTIKRDGVYSLETKEKIIKSRHINKCSIIGDTIVVMEENKKISFYTPNGVLIDELPHTAMKNFTISPNNQYLLSFDNRMVLIWDIKEGKLKHRLDMPGEIMDIIFKNSNNDILLWDNSSFIKDINIDKNALGINTIFKYPKNYILNDVLNLNK